MEYKLIKLKRAFYMAVLLTVCINTYGQVRISNSINNMAAANSPAFIDASSNPTYNQSANIGKGLLYPRTDLAAFTAFSGSPTGVPNSYPTLYDGLFVYNTKDGGVAGVGSTEGTLCRGLWYYDNPTSTITGGTWRSVRPCTATGTITTLNCAGATNTGTLIAGTAASGVSSAIGYTGGNGGTYDGQSVASTGITGLTATLASGSFVNGTGTLTYMITGTPSGPGTASFAINIGGQSCAVSFIVNAATAACGANIAPGVYKQFMCHNLGADTNLDPFVPAAGIHGAKYQWGRGTPALTQAQDQASGGVISGWNTTGAPAGSWSDAVKTVNDPCPAGYRVPTRTQWEGVINNNSLTVLGTWVSPNYTSALKLGANLLLPAADNRNYSTGSRAGGFGARADYWSSTQGFILQAFKDVGGNVIPGVTNSSFFTWGMPVRCISE
jgi:hypothetical protein